MRTLLVADSIAYCLDDLTSTLLSSSSNTGNNSDSNSRDAASTTSLSASSAIPSTPELIDQLSTVEVPGLKTIDTGYDPGLDANQFQWRGKSMKERHGPTEKLREDASKAYQPKNYEEFERLVRHFYSVLVLLLITY